MKYLYALSLLLLVSSCGLLWEYRSLHEFEDYTWAKNDVQRFEFEIQEEGLYDVILLLRHVYGFPFSQLDLSLQMNGEVLSVDRNIAVPIIGSDKKYLGRGSGDLWDVDYIVLDNQNLTPGTYTITVAHLMSQEDLKLLMQLGIMVKAK